MASIERNDSLTKVLISKVAHQVLHAGEEPNKPICRTNPNPAEIYITTATVVDVTCVNCQVKLLKFAQLNAYDDPETLPVYHKLKKLWEELEDALTLVL